VIGRERTKSRSQVGLPNDGCWRTRSSRVLAPLLTAIVFASGCGRNPAQPSPPTLAISCPSPLMLYTADGTAVLGNFAAPQATGGTAPVTTSCDRPSGSAFPPGPTQVTCTARDASRQTASCSFGVSVIRVPAIAATRFVAFGDSITEGQIDTPCGPALTFADYLLALRGSQFLFDPSAVYPARLRTLLNGRYLAQTVSVLNAGVGGETTDRGSARLPGVLAANPADALILLEGVNDLSTVDLRGPTATIPSIVAGLRSMIRTGRGRGLPVFVGTLLPERPASCRGSAWTYIADTNNAIRPMVASEGAVLVDLYAAFGGAAGDLIGPDGLHPSAAGHQKIAETFFAAIRAQLER
jgi:lysophospholipase L1-like esterase